MFSIMGRNEIHKVRAHQKSFDPFFFFILVLFFTTKKGESGNGTFFFEVFQTLWT
jgi:hypothetical protein